MGKKVKSLQALNKEALKEKLNELHKELMKENSQIASGTRPKNPGLVREVKRNIARIHTILNERRSKAKA